MTKKYRIAASVFLFMTMVAGAGASRAESPRSTQEPEFADLAGPGKKNKIDDTCYFTWEFAQKPKMGPAILKIKLYDPDGNRRTDMTIIGRSDMPSMRGAHDSGDVPFKLNKKGDYLLPVDIVMPGDWEIRLTFQSGDAVLFRGRIAFDV